MSSIAVKLNVNGVIRRFQFQRNQSFDDLVEAALKLYPELPKSVTFTYKDEDGDVIDVSTDGDVLAALAVADQESWTAIRFNVAGNGMAKGAPNDTAATKSRAEPSSQKPDLQLLSSSLHESFTVVGEPVKTPGAEAAIPVAVEVEKGASPAPAPPTEAPDAEKAIAVPGGATAQTPPSSPAEKPSSREDSKVTPPAAVPLRATSGGALIYRDGTVEFGMGGEAVLLPDGQTISCILSYKGFPSVAASGLALTRGKWYYEVSLLTPGLMQIGWCTSKFTGSSNDGEGVGDDTHSYAYDGFRRLKWSNGDAQRFGPKWKAGDVVCCAVDVNHGVIQYALNGEWNDGWSHDTVAFSNLDLQKDGLMPAVSFQKGEKCCINFGATTFSYGPPSPDFSSVNSAFQSEFNRAAQFPTAASVPAPFPDAAPSATEQLAAMLLKDGVRDAISRFLGHPVVATVVQHIIVAVVNDPGSAARVAQSQIQVVTPIFLQLVSEQPALLGLLPNVLELVKALFLGSGSVHHREPPRATVMHPQARGNSRGCGRRKGRGGWNRCHHNPNMPKPAWNGWGNAGKKHENHKHWKRQMRCPDRKRDNWNHGTSKCPVSRVHQAFSSLVKETGEQVSKWASNLCPESDADKKFKNDLQKAIDMSMPAGKAKPPSYEASTSPFTAGMDRKYLVPGNNGGNCRVRFQPPVKNFDKFPAPEGSKPPASLAQASPPEKSVAPADTLGSIHGDLEKAIALSYEEQVKAKGKPLPAVEFSDLDRAIALSYEEQACTKAPQPTASVLPEKKSVFGEDADDLFEQMFASPKEDQKVPAKAAEDQKVPPEAAGNDNRLRAKFIEQRTFDVETGAVVDLSSVQPNTRVAHTWTMVNPSTEAWPTNIVGKTVGGDLNIIKTPVWKTPSPVAAQSPVHITVEALSPNEPGRYISYFRLFDQANRPFGDRIWLDVTVSGSSSDTDWDMLHGEAKVGQQ